MEALTISSRIRRRLYVFVDAKIIRMDVKPSQRRAFVAYVVKGKENLSDFKEVEASETDEAEEQGVLFAITSLQRRSIRRFTVICDHESAVTKINWKGDERRKLKKDKVLPEIWRELEKNQSIEIVPLGSNPAHAYLNRRIKETGLDS
jgi:ribonuclease HI